MTRNVFLHCDDPPRTRATRQKKSLEGENGNASVDRGRKNRQIPFLHNSKDMNSEFLSSDTNLELSAWSYLF